MNSDRYTFAFLGGDKRQAVIAEMLIRCGHKVKCFGLGEYGVGIVGAEQIMTYEKAISGSDVILLPLPVSRDNFTLSLSGEKILLSDILKCAGKSGCGVILGGMFPIEFMRLGKEYGIQMLDYYLSEDLQRKNALPSAEGSLMLAMEQTEITVEGMRSLVCGYGRIGSCLARILQRLGSDVTVVARREESLNEASLCGYKTVKLGSGSSLRDNFEKSDVVFNTIPATIFTKETIESAKGKTLYIEIASAPYGIDVSDARDCGVRILFAPSLPGKYAPLSAGIYIFETVADLLRDIGMEICHI